MKMWLRVVLPPDSIVMAAVLAYLAFTFAPILISRYFGGRGTLPSEFQAAAHFLCLMTIAYGTFRGAAFHPVCLSDYREWLDRTPWHIGLPLPLGPIHIVWQDLLYIGCLTSLSLLHQSLELWYIGAAFLASYLATSGMCLYLTRQSWYAYALAFGLGGALLLKNVPAAAILLLVGLYAIAWHGLRMSLRHFHEWNLEAFETQSLFQLDGKKHKEAVQKRALGWPFDRLGPHRFRFPVSRTWAGALGLLIGWWLYVLIAALPASDGLGLAQMTYSGVLFLAAGRLYAYMAGYPCSINLGGRLKTLRWIIPRYDVIFLAPIFILLLSACGRYLTSEFHFSEILVAPVLLAASVFVALACPPTLDEWRLTGAHRITSTNAFEAGEFQQTQ